MSLSTSQERFARSLRGAAVLAALAALTTPCLADVLKLKDGRTLTGRVVSDDAETLVFETRVRGMRMTSKHPRSSVLSLVKEETVGPTYCALPVTGPIGRQQGVEGPFVSAPMFKEALDEIARIKPEYVVLVIDSPGGSLDEMQQIIESIGAHPDLKFVAYVKKAISAAAIIAMRCPTLCMAPNATMGGAVPFKLGPDGTPQVIEEKFQSILRAEFRRAAELGGHSPLIAQAMMDPDLQLWLADQNGKPSVIDAPAGRGGGPVRTLKLKGQILTLTAGEAQACGVSVGTAANIDAVAALVGLKSWRSADDKPWFQMVNAAEAEQWRDDKKRQQTAKMNAWAAAAKEIRDDLEAIAEQLKQAEARRDAAVKHAQGLVDAQKEELAALQQEWDAQRVSIAGSSTTNAALNATTRRRLTDIDAAFGARRTALKDRTDPEIQDAVKKAKAHEAEMKKLHDQWTQLRDKLPAKPKD